VTLVQPIPTAQHEVVAGVLDLGVIRLAWLDIDISESPIEAWGLFGAVEPYYTVVLGSTGEV
jgi:hypothetical protein